MRRLRGLRNLVHDAVEVTTNLVERTHESVAARYVGILREIDPIAPQVEAVDDVRRLTTAGVFGTIRAVNEGIRQLGNFGHDAVAASLEGANAPRGPDVAASAADASATRAQGTGASDTDASTTDAPDVPTTELDAGPAGTSGAADPRWRLLETAQGALNGFFGDFLRERGNELAIPMQFRHRGRALALAPESLAQAFPATTGKLCVFVHGLGCTERAWMLGGERFWGDPDAAFGLFLQRDLGYTALYLRYNTGLHVSENGRALSELLDDLVAAFPVEVAEIALVGHSMGGLVARSAAHYGAQDARAWVPKLRHIFCLGSPHLGAPLEQATHVLSSVLRAFDAAGTQVPAAVLESRSAGVKDMRHGYVLDEDWRESDPDAFMENNRRDAPFVDGVAYYFVASTITRDPTDPLGQLVGDLLLRPASASGRAAEPARRIAFPIGRVLGGIHHMELVNHPDVYAQLRHWLDPAAD